MVSFSRKAILFFGIFSKAADAGTVIGDPVTSKIPQENCVVAYAYDAGKAVCTADYADPLVPLWSNGPYGAYACEDCGCDECPTEPPAPNTPPSKAPTPNPIPLPQKCTGISGSWSGDPHFKTFDKLNYDCQGQGEFEVVTSKYITVQGRFAKFKPEKRPTVTKAVAWKHEEGGTDVVQATVPDTPVVLDDGRESCLPYIHINKKPQGSFMPTGTTQIWLTDTIEVKYQKKKNLEGYIFYHRNSNVQVEVMGKRSSANGCVMAVKLCLPEEWNKDGVGEFVGLLGNADGKKMNDWMNRGQKEGAVPAGKKERKFGPAYEWCKQWCLQEESKSLFVYEGDDSFTEQAKGCELETDVEILDCIEKPDQYVPGLSEVCQANDYSCLIDGCVGGLEEAVDLLTTEATQVDFGCGKELIRIDFSEKELLVDKTWGDIGFITTGVVPPGEVGGNPFLLLVPGMQERHHIMAVPANAQLIEVELKFIESGTWDRKDSDNGKHFEDDVYIDLWDPTANTNDPSTWKVLASIDLKGFSKNEREKNVDEYYSGSSNGVLWHRYALTPTGQDFGIGKSSNQKNDQMHKVVIQIPPSFYEETGAIWYSIYKKTDAQDEYAGIDDLRITAYGLQCDIPEEKTVPGDKGIIYDYACGEIVLHVDFTEECKDGDHTWGNVEEIGGGEMLVLDKHNSELEVWHYGFPTLADALVVEFEMYALREEDGGFVQGDWSACIDPSPQNRHCNSNKFEIRVGGKKVVDIDTFEKGFGATTHGKKNEIEWTRNLVSENIIRVELVVPPQYFSENVWVKGSAAKDMDIKFQVKGMKRNDIAIGLNELRITTFAKGCEAENAELLRGRRNLREFMQNIKLPQSLAEGAYPRQLSAESGTGECTCLCPTLPDGTGDDRSAPRKFNFYAFADADCGPSGPSLGSLTMKILPDDKAEITYEIDGEFTVKDSGLWVGKTALPDGVVDSLPIDEFPYLAGFVANTGTITADLLNCDFYASGWVRLCGEIPAGTEAPTPAQTNEPTPAQTDAPTPSDRNAPTTKPPKIFSPTPAPSGGRPTPAQTDAPTPSDRNFPTIKPPKIFSPTPAPSGGSASGDPHIVSWGGEKWDFHGGCDLVLVDNPSFHNGLGMTIHIRTKIVTWWSYIETAVVRIGDDTLEVTGGKDHQYLINGVVGDNNAGDFLFSSLGLKVHLKQASAKQLKVRVDLLNADAIGFEVYKDFVRVNVKMMDKKWNKFEGSVGLMGKYPHGEFVGRDGKTVFTDYNAFGQEWQVLESEPKLFHTADGPQHPTQCMMPQEVSTEEKRRRLGEGMITREDAEIACSRVGEGSRDACIFDVMATNDLDMAGSY